MPHSDSPRCMQPADYHRLRLQAHHDQKHHVRFRQNASDATDIKWKLESTARSRNRYRRSGCSSGEIKRNNHLYAPYGQYMSVVRQNESKIITKKERKKRKATNRQTQTHNTQHDSETMKPISDDGSAVGIINYQMPPKSPMSHQAI